MNATDRYSAAGGQAGTVSMAAFTILAWSSIFPVTRWALQWFSPFELVTLRLMTAALVMALVLLWIRPPLPSPRQFAVLALCAVLGVALYNVLLSWGLVTLSAGAASFLTNSIPIFTCIISVAVNGERMSPRTIAGTLVAFLGIAILASGQPGGLTFGSGATLVLTASVCSAFYIVIQRRLVHQLTPLETGSWLFILGALAMLPFSFGAFKAAASAPLWPLAVVALLAIIPGALGQIAWLRVLRQMPAGRAASLLYLIPPLATGLGVLLLGETVSVRLIAGGALAIAGVALVNGIRPRRIGNPL